MREKITVTYIYHSCYTVETNDLFIVFDYYKGYLNIPKNKQVIFIASHGHSDHYTSEILKVPDMENKTYILSSDIGKLASNENIIYIRDDKISMDQIKSLYSSKNVHLINENHSYNINLNNGKTLKIKTFGSTDKGVSILIYLNDVTIFHAGDLNFWAWPRYNDKEMQKEYDDFMKEIEKIKKQAIDIAFFPVDPRLGENYYKGADIFIREVHPQIFFPMHFANNNEVSRKFKEKFIYEGTDIRQIFEANQEILIDIND